MVKRLIIKVLIQVLSSVGKSAMKAYKETAQSQKGGKNTNPFTEFFQQTLQTANLAHKPMFKGDALKILQIEEKDLNPELIISRFWIQFHKNDPVKGGSFYLQSMIFNAKQELLKDFQNVDEKEIIKKIEEQYKKKQSDNQEIFDSENKNKEQNKQ